MPLTGLRLISRADGGGFPDVNQPEFHQQHPGRRPMSVETVAKWHGRVLIAQ